MVREAARLVAEGCFPGPRKGRKSEFIARCAQALRRVAPKAETVLTNLSAEEQVFIRRNLGGEEAYQGCLAEGCLDKEIVWVTKDWHFPGEPPMQVSRCAHCHKPKVFGRTVFSLEDLLKDIRRLDWGVDAHNQDTKRARHQ